MYNVMYAERASHNQIAEFADPDVVVTLSNLAGDEEKYTVKDLLPGVFTQSHMD